MAAPGRSTENPGYARISAVLPLRIGYAAALPHTTAQPGVPPLGQRELKALVPQDCQPAG